jgi:septal ring factor EnvC (AmiA/AmiB activator)
MGTKDHDLRVQLREAKEEITNLRLSIAEAAQKETNLTRMLQRADQEKKELQKQLEAERFRLNGFQLELQARHYELPFLAAQVQALSHAAQWPMSVASILTAMQQSISAMIAFGNGQLPSLDPASWLVLAKKLGLAAGFQSRRTPALPTNEVQP